MLQAIHYPITLPVLCVSRDVGLDCLGGGRLPYIPRSKQSEFMVYMGRVQVDEER